MDDACSRSGAGVGVLAVVHTMTILHKRSSILRNVDDTPLGVIHTHGGVAGLLGGLLTRPGLLAVPTLCSLFLPVTNSKGAFYGDGAQFGKQLAGAVFIIVWN
jgi:ammonium transporter, Amt family